MRQPPSAESAGNPRTTRAVSTLTCTILREFIGDRAIIGHNVDWHADFLEEELKRAGFGELDNERFCTMERYRETFPEKKSDLASVAAESGRARKGRYHIASEDALLTGIIAFTMYAVDSSEENTVEVPVETSSGSGGWSLW